MPDHMSDMAAHERKKSRPWPGCGCLQTDVREGKQPDREEVPAPLGKLSPRG